MEREINWILPLAWVEVSYYLFTPFAHIIWYRLLSIYNEHYTDLSNEFHVALQEQKIEEKVADQNKQQKYQRQQRFYNRIAACYLYFLICM